MLFPQVLVCVRGGGDLATGVAYRLFRAGFPTIVLELEQPLVIRREVAFAQAIFQDEIEVDGVRARSVASATEAVDLARAGLVPVLADPAAEAITALKPAVVVDARMIKANRGDTDMDQAPLVIALGPGYTAGGDCHVVVETNRGHDLGRVIRDGMAEPDTGVPGVVRGRGAERVLRAPADGEVVSAVKIGDLVKEGQRIAIVGGQPLLAPFDGVLRGLVHDGVVVKSGKKMGDVDPRSKREYCFTISEKALAVGGGVVDAVLSASQIQQLIVPSQAG